MWGGEFVVFSIFLAIHLLLVNRWLSVRFNVLSSGIMGVMALVAVLNPRVDAALAGFALAFANGVTSDLLFMVRDLPYHWPHNDISVR